MQKYDKCEPESMMGYTKIIKLNCAFATHSELKGEFDHDELVDPVKSKRFHERFNHTKPVCVKLDSGMLLKKVKLDPSLSSKKQKV